MVRTTFALLIAGLVSLPLAWGDEPTVFRSDVSLVRVEAQVLDRDNRAITGLGLRDFTLRENGRPVTIESVDTENAPIDLLLLLDVSASMRPHIERIASASHQAMRQLRDRDRVAIMVFDRVTRVRMDFRSSQSDVDREFERLLDQENFRGGTDITRALFDASDYIRDQARREARKAIVIVTDDQTERDRDVPGVSRSLERADAVLSALIAPNAMQNRTGGQSPGGYPGGGSNGPLGPLGGIIFGQPRGRRPGGGQMGSHTQSAGTEEIARESGGDSMRLDDAYALEDTLTRIRQRYALHFYLPAGARAGEERDIDVELVDAVRSRYPGADLRYRRTYYAPANLSSSAPGNSEPTLVRGGTAGASSSASDDPGPPTLRRPGVSQVPDSSRQGPLGIDSQSSAPAAPPPSPSAGPSATPSQPPPSATQPQPADPNAPGWRKARPEDQPPPPQ